MNRERKREWEDEAKRTLAGLLTMILFAGLLTAFIVELILSFAKGTETAKPAAQPSAEPVAWTQEAEAETEEPEVFTLPEPEAVDVCEPVPDPLMEKVGRLKTDHQTAGRVYEYLHCLGWGDIPIAGVLGNLMAECGGQTLTLDWDEYVIDVDGALHYGMCGWSLRFCPEVGGLDVDGQLTYLADTVRKNMKQFGGDLDTFLSLEDAGEAARYFCTYYERGRGLEQRAENAAAALAWINGEGEA